MTPWNAKQMSSYDIRSHVQSHLARWWAGRQNRTMNKGGWIWSVTHTCMVQGWTAYYNLEYGMIMAELSHLVGVGVGWVATLEPDDLVARIGAQSRMRWYLDGFLLIETTSPGIREPWSSTMILVLKALRSHFSRDIGLPAARKIWDRCGIKSRLEGLVT